MSPVPERRCQATQPLHPATVTQHVCIERGPHSQHRCTCGYIWFTPAGGEPYE